MPGTAHDSEDFAKKHSLPVEAAKGGAETMYPEYRDKIKDKFVRPEKCTINCGRPAGGGQ